MAANGAFLHPRARGGTVWCAGRPRFDKFSCAISANKGMRRHVDTTVEENPKPALTVRNSMSRPLSAAFGNGSGRARNVFGAP